MRYNFFKNNNKLFITQFGLWFAIGKKDKNNLISIYIQHSKTMNILQSRIVNIRLISIPFRQKMSTWKYLMSYFDDFGYDPPKDKVLYRGDFADVFNKPILFNDKQINGLSKCTLSEVNENNEIFLRSNVTLQKTIVQPSLDPTNRRATVANNRSYCAFKIDFQEVHDLRDYEAFRFTLRCDAPAKYLRCTLNLTTVSMFEDDLFQVPLEIPISQSWVSLHIPFESFSVTGGGHARHQQRANDSLRVEAIGFLFYSIIDEEVGSINDNFTLEIKDVTAVLDAEIDMNLLKKKKKALEQQTLSIKDNQKS